MVLERLVHVRFDRITMGDHVFQNFLFDEPPKEVELADGRDEGLDAAGLEHDPLPATEGIEQPLAVGVEFPLVVKVDEKMLSGSHEGGIHLLSVVGDKVVDKTQTDGGGSVDDRKELLKIAALGVEFL